MNNTLFLFRTWELFDDLRCSIAFISLSNLFECIYFLVRCSTDAVESWPQRPHRWSPSEGRLCSRRETWRFLFSNLLPVTYLTVVTHTSYRLVWRMNELAQSLYGERLSANVSEGGKTSERIVVSLNSQTICFWSYLFSYLGNSTQRHLLFYCVEKALALFRSLFMQQRISR